MGYLIIFKSVTHAQNIIFYLNKNAVMAHLVQPPLSLGTGSCSYGVKIRPGDFVKAKQLIDKTSVQMVKVYQILPNEAYQEVRI